MTPERPTLPPLDLARLECRLSRVWEEKGRLSRALAGYEKVLGTDPKHREAHVGRVRVLTQLADFAGAVVAGREALRSFPEEASLQKHFIRALTSTTGGLDQAFAEYDLRAADERPVAIKPGALLCCAVVRNERLRLEYWLAYYRRQGVDAFLIVDNGSSDGTVEYLLAQPDVHLWQSALSFNAANFGSAWFEILLQAHGQDHWVLIVDADELLHIVDGERRTIRRLCDELDGRGKSAYFALLLDMYADQPITQTHVAPGDPFEVACPYFDRQPYHRRFEQAGPFANVPMIFGGVRERVFGPAGEYLLSKVPLVKYTEDCVLAGGQHFTSYPAAAFADETGALLHFKFLEAFTAYAHQEALRQEHAMAGMQYKEYSKGLTSRPDLCLFDPLHSERFVDTAGLETSGIISRHASVPPPLTAHLPTIPTIDPVPAEVTRPFWSVVVTVYDRTAFLPATLRHLLNLDPSGSDMHIEVVQDGGVAPAVRDQAEAIVEQVGGGRIGFHAAPARLGQPEIFNYCVRRAQGHWIHLLHDDDWVDAGFYAALESGIRFAPEVGVAMSRWRFVGEDGVDEGRPPRAERDTPGVIPDWQARVAVVCRVQMPAIVVRREAYEAVGGYWAAAGSAFDWDMWKRLAVRYPTWYDPAMLANFRQHPGSLSHGLMASGQQVADARRSIELAQAYLPPADVGRLTVSALEHYARHALDLAVRQLKADLPDAALANVREGLLCARSDRAVRDLREVLIRVHDARRMAHAVR